MYVIAGGLVIPFMNELQAALTENQIQLIIAGGVAYVIGAIIYALKKPNPFPKYFGYHEIFHLLVIAGATLHFIAVNKVIK